MNTQERSIELVHESSKLLISLATGFIAFTVTLSSNPSAFEFDTNWEKWTLSFSWLFMLISIACGVWTLLGLTTVLAPSTPVGSCDAVQAQQPIREKTVKFPFAFQIVSFGISAIFMVLYGVHQVFL